MCRYRLSACPPTIRAGAVGYSLMNSVPEEGDCVASPYRFIVELL